MTIAGLASLGKQSGLLALMHVCVTRNRAPIQPLSHALSRGTTPEPPILSNFMISIPKMGKRDIGSEFLQGRVILSAFLFSIPKPAKRATEIRTCSKKKILGIGSRDLAMGALGWES